MSVRARLRATLAARCIISITAFALPRCSVRAQVTFVDQSELIDAGVSRTYGGLHFTSPETGYVFTDTEILATTDGGASWQLLQTIPGSRRIKQAIFLDRATALIYADHGDVSTAVLLRTTDGFTSLQPMGNQFQRHDEAVTGFVYNVFFVDADHGWGMGGPNHITVTTDGGRTWTGYLVPTALGEPERTVMFVPTAGLPPIPPGVPPPITGIAETDKGMIKTTDGGAIWAAIPGAPRRLRDLQCAGAAACFALDVQNQVLESLDGGGAWQLQALPLDKPPLYDGHDQLHSFQVASPTRAYLFGVDTHLPARGQRDIVRPDGLRFMPELSPQTSFVIIYDGSTWTRRDYAYIKSIGVGQFVDDLNGWAVSSANNIFRTTDGGQTWTTVQDYFRQIAAQTPSPTPLVLPTPTQTP